jgi:hypothetical protein
MVFDPLPATMLAKVVAFASETKARRPLTPTVGSVATVKTVRLENPFVRPLIELACSRKIFVSEINKEDIYPDTPAIDENPPGGVIVGEGLTLLAVVNAGLDIYLCVLSIQKWFQ